MAQEVPFAFTASAFYSHAAAAQGKFESGDLALIVIVRGCGGYDT